MEDEKLPKQKGFGKQWDFVAPMQSERWCHSATAHRNFIYSIGGKDGNWKELASVERYNINSNSWESVASLQSNRCYHASVCFGDSIFCIGGLSNVSLTNIVEKYDINGLLLLQSSLPDITLELLHTESSSLQLEDSIVVLWQLWRNTTF